MYRLTRLSLALGFLTLMLSAWQTTLSFELLAALAILGALVATLFVLHALVSAIGERSGMRPNDLALAPRSVGGR